MVPSPILAAVLAACIAAPNGGGSGQETERPERRSVDFKKYQECIAVGEQWKGRATQCEKDLKGWEQAKERTLAIVAVILVIVLVKQVRE